MPPFVAKMLVKPSTWLLIALLLMFATWRSQVAVLKIKVEKRDATIATLTAKIEVQNLAVERLKNEGERQANRINQAAANAATIRDTTARRIRELQRQPIPQECNEAIAWAAKQAQLQGW